MGGKGGSLADRVSVMFLRNEDYVFFALPLPLLVVCFASQEAVHAFVVLVSDIIPRTLKPKTQKPKCCMLLCAVFISQHGGMQVSNVVI